MASASEPDLLEDRIQSVRRRDRRFSRQAYYFVLDALDYTMSELGKDELTGEERHVGGRDLLRCLREYAADQFGPMASVVFERWGVTSTEDFGEIVFNLIDAELLSRRPQDSRRDFVDGFDFAATFAAKYRERLELISAGR
ncbi:MAG TPA: Minf_1886 family protein [Planctomycetota bacterium]|nr:Minf_1886 family protein [Planctomycetota bacterium]